MKKLLMTLALLMATAMQSWGVNDWYLYFWSETYGLNGDAGQFAATDEPGVFRLEGCEVKGSGINFCVHNADWSVIYGWKDSSVESTGVSVPLAAATNASGWLALEAGTYDVTFNLNKLTIQFDVRAADQNDSYLRGGDISMLDYVEDLGAKFYDTDGSEKDALDIMQQHGVNIVRLRLYNAPGNTVTYKSGGRTYSYALPEGYLGEDDVLKLALRAKQRDMQIQLTFHYSDFWTNGEMQLKPAGWEDLTFDELKQAVYDYTYNFLQRMNAQGTTPDYVSLGNEIQSGLLFGYYTSDKGQINSVNGYCDNMANVAALLAQGSAAVRSACPEAKVVIHLTLSTGINAGTYKWFFDEMQKNGLDYDVVGASYYPFWTDQKPAMLTGLANSMYARYGKPLLVMETGYSWTPYRPGGRYGGNYEGQLHLNGSVYNEATEAGQKAFMQELQAVIRSNSHILGYLYWDPVMVEQRVNGSWIKTGWVQGGENLVGNTTWFDYTGKALPVFEAIAEAAAIDQAGVHETVVTRDDAARGLSAYNLAGQREDASRKGLVIINGKKQFNR